jgi:hypothetical protein
MGRKKRTRRPYTAQEIANIYYWKYGLGKSNKQISKVVSRTSDALNALRHHIDHDAMEYRSPLKKEPIYFGDLARQDFPSVKEIAAAKKEKELSVEPNLFEQDCKGHQLTDVQGLILHLTEANIDRSLKLRLIGELL